MKKKCAICGNEFEININPRRKYCSNECSYEAWKKYIREWRKEKYRISAEFREKAMKSHKKWVAGNREKLNAYYREYKKKHREKLRKQRKRRKLQLIPNNVLSFLKKIADEQQVFIYVMKLSCEACGSKKHLVLHEIRYSPLKTVTLCSKCHAILHHCLLDRKKVKKRIKVK